MPPLTEPYRLSHEVKDLETASNNGITDASIPAQTQRQDVKVSRPTLEDFVFYATAQRISERVADGLQ